MRLNDNQRIAVTELPVKSDRMGPINKIAGTQPGVFPSPFGNTQKSGRRQSYEVSLDLIKPRPVNDYAITGIDDLAESIKRTGLWQPVILRKDPENNGKYIIVDGERRYTAVKRIWQKAITDNNEADKKLYSTISAFILTPEEVEKEALIYNDTNEFSRQITNFERILRMDPLSIDLTKPEVKHEYVELCFGEDTDDSSITVRGSIIEKTRYIAAFLNRKNPDLDISEATVKNYLIFISRSASALLHAILKGIISLRDARSSISYLSEEDQLAAITATEEEYARLLEKGFGIAKKSQTVPAKTKEPEDLISSASKISKKLYGARKDFEKIYSDTTYRKDLNENQKEYLAKLRLAMAAIEAVKVAEDRIRNEAAE